MNSANRAQKVLLALLLLNGISTWLHYTDNALFVKQYPGPEWFTTAGIFATVMVMTPIGLLGYWLYTKRMFWLAYGCLGLYSITSISSPGHYLFPIVVPMSVKMHSLIWLDAISGTLLIGFILWSMLAAQEWRVTADQLPTP
ncbi:hypothetical protein C7B61_21525 [filamentous cyanobacterium CCP1]|nr:hypothetical protein C7B76_10360 [filamentous cyanobacterium CCP2]PSB55242.1 hypothetical protein C7B61_21525 [filamentous cyanobacterium CCP1]